MWTTLTQVFVVDTMTWEYGERLPDIRAFSSHVDYLNTTLMVGGWGGYDRFYDTILQWEPDTKTWFERGERIARPREKMCSIMTEDMKVGCIA